jgi:phospholipase C
MKRFLHRLLFLGMIFLIAGVSACSSKVSPIQPAAFPTLTPDTRIPAFTHVFIVFLENEDYTKIIDSSQMPNFNRWAKEYTLLTDYYAVSHPSLPNYLALISGSTFGVTKDCTDCFQNTTSLPDLLESAGFTWKTYQEDMPGLCFIGNHSPYMQKHNPFVYFDAVRKDKARCERSVVPLGDLEKDLAAHTLPNFAFIMPNMCNSGHDCGLNTADEWLGKTLKPILESPDFDKNSLLVVSFDEGTESTPCCGLASTGGRVATVLVSPAVRKGFEDNTPYTHYSLLKTISAAWGLQPLGQAADSGTNLILTPWEK